MPAEPKPSGCRPEKLAASPASGANGDNSAMAHKPSYLIVPPRGGRQSIVRIARTRRSDLVKEACRHDPGQFLPGVFCVLPV